LTLISGRIKENFAEFFYLKSQISILEILIEFSGLY